MLQGDEREAAVRRPQPHSELAGFEGDYRDLWWNRDFLELMATRWGLARRRTLLDVGCGAGHWGLTVLGLLPAEATLVGVDAEPSFLAHARERASARGLAERCEFLAGRAEALPYADESFDVVTCQTVLIHVTDAELVIREMARVLRPGGILIAAEPDNLAGNVALLGTSLATTDEDIVEIVALLTTCQRGKAALPIISGTEHESRRLHEAGGGSPEAFARGWAAVQRWLGGFVREVEAGRFSSGRGFVMYVASGEKPGAPHLP